MNSSFGQGEPVCFHCLYRSGCVKLEWKPRSVRLGILMIMPQQEPLIELYKKEVGWREGPWPVVMLWNSRPWKWVHWYSHTRTHSYCKDLAPAQFEDHYYTETSQPEVADVPLWTLHRTRDNPRSHRPHDPDMQQALT